jgi:asparagine synthase (glutamine-hydrolysing)
VCEKFLPRQILKRKKRGFGVNVVDAWFQSAAKGKFTDVLLDGSSLMFSLLNPVPVKKLLDDHQSRRQDNNNLLFSLVMFEQWLRGVRSAG